MKKKIVIDIIQNLFSTFLPLFGLQFVILPILAKNISADQYGQLLLVTSLINLFSISFGNVLNNSRLIRNNEYKFDVDYGDYKILLFIFILVNSIVFSLMLFFFKSKIVLNLIDFAILILSSTLLLIVSYSSVEFRLKLSYWDILIDGSALLIGYFVGFLFFLLTNNWVYIFFIGYLLSFIYNLYKTRILFEPLKQSPIFRNTVSQTLLLLVSGFLVSLGTYADRLLIYPLLGSELLTIYYISTIFGKTITMGISPVTSVLLTYLSRLDRFSKKNFRFLLAMITLLGIIAYFTILLSSRVLLSILYPQYLTRAIEFVPITGLATVVSMTAGFLNPIILRFTHTRWQLFINTFHIIVYMVLSYFLQLEFGLMGFCYSILISNILRLFFILFVYFLHSDSIDYGV